MDFSFTEDQLALKDAATAFARQELNCNYRERERLGVFPHDEWRACARFGIQGLAMPPEWGGRGEDIVTVALTMEGLGYGCQDNGLVFALNAQMWSVQIPLLKFGTPAQQQAYLGGLISGALIGAHGVTEPEAGSDAFSMRTRADREPGYYVLNGTKRYITSAPVADVFIVFASLHPGQGFAGVTAFVVEKGHPGLTVTRTIEKMGLRTAQMGEFTLTDCRVPEENRLGREGAGMAIFNSSMEWERSCILASAIGAMQRQLETCIQYARTRQQFGQPIGKFQSVANKIADMRIRLEAARLLIYRIAWLRQQGKPAMAEAALAKVFVSEAWVQSSLDAIQIHGAYGYTTDAEVERDLRDAVAAPIYSGTSEVQRMIIARTLGL
jgi:alkylation response protein AidB-like acyl-CoA dehydrogenase